MKTLTALLLGLITLIAACVPPSTGTDCDSIKKQALRDTCYAEVGIVRQDVNLCDMASDSRTKFYCYTKVAQATRAPALCELVKDLYWQPICFRELGAALGDEAICDKVADPKLQNACFFDIAESTGDPQLCRRIIGDWQQFYRCFDDAAIDQQNVSVCFELEDDLARDRCIFGLAKNTSNSSLCSLMAFNQTNEICVERISPTTASS